MCFEVHTEFTPGSKKNVLLYICCVKIKDCPDPNKSCRYRWVDFVTFPFTALGPVDFILWSFAQVVFCAARMSSFVSNCSEIVGRYVCSYQRHAGLQMATAELQAGCSTCLAKSGAGIESVHVKWEKGCFVVNKRVFVLVSYFHLTVIIMFCVNFTTCRRTGDCLHYCGRC